jgi:arabinogalactan endo-1,4-beta-galactosidase
MDDLEKLRVLLPHWLEHNAGHGQEFARWAALFEGNNQEIAALLREASASLQDADAALRKALHLSGGEMPGHEHHHHNLPG